MDKDEVWLNFFFRFFSNARKASTIIFIEGCQALFRSQNDKTSVSVTTTFSLKRPLKLVSSKWRRLSRFPAKMTLRVHARALLKVSYSPGAQICCRRRSGFVNKRSGYEIRSLIRALLLQRQQIMYNENQSIENLSLITPQDLLMAAERGLNLLEGGQQTGRRNSSARSRPRSVAGKR